MIVYIRTTPLPRCRSCGKRMEYYVPGLPDSEHEHPGCAGARWAKEAMAKAEKKLKKALEAKADGR